MSGAVDFLTGGPASPAPLPSVLGRPARTGMTREERTRKRGSPFFPLSLGALAAGAVQHYDLEESAALAKALKYDHLDFIRVANNDVVDLLLTLGEDEQLYCPAGTMQTLREKPYRNFSITNLDAATAATAGKVRIECKRDPISQDKLLRERL